MKRDASKFVFAVKANKLLLKNTEDKTINKLFKNAISIKHAALFYQISMKFHLSTPVDLSLRYIERHFPTVAGSRGFLELDFNSVMKLLSSSQLQCDTEVEVFNSAESWLGHNFDERAKFAKYLLLKIRFSLLPEHVLTYLSNRSSFINSNEECKALMKDLPYRKINTYQNKLKNINKTRYCNQNKFNTIICGGCNIESSNAVRNTHSINMDQLKYERAFPRLVEGRRFSKVLCVKEDVYVFGGSDGDLKCVNSVEKYSLLSNKWEYVTGMHDDREQFSACSFMDKVYLFGGNYRDKNRTVTNSCIQFNTKDQTWKECAEMNQHRTQSACAVFQGSIVVCGGGSNVRRQTNTVEVYDHVADAWSYMPNMMHTKRWHSLVAIRNKLFVIGSYTQKHEVYDSNFKSFVFIKSNSPLNFFVNAISVGNEIIIYGFQTEIILFYDVQKNKWTEKKFKLTKKLSEFCCAKIPQF